MKRENRTYKVLNMCNFCANDSGVCKADRVFSKAMSVDNGKVDSKDAVVACDKYTNPVTSLLTFC